MSTPSSSPWALQRRTAAVAAEVSRSRADAMISWLRDYAGRRLNSQLIDERRCIPPYVALDMGNAGLMGILVEEEYGGRALRFADVGRLTEQLAAIDLGLGTWHLTTVFAGTRTLGCWATEECKQRWLPALAQGRVLGAFAQTEPAVGSDFTALSTRARPTPRGWSLSGEKHWIGNGSWAGIAAVVARVVDEHGVPGDIGAFAVPMDSPGARAGEEHLSLGMRGMVQSRLHFDEVSLDPSLVLAGGRGAQVAVDAMMSMRFALAAAALGTTKRVLQLAHRFATRRAVSGRTLYERTVTLEALGEMAARIEICDAVVYGIAERVDQGLPVEMETLVAAKTLTGEWLVDAADRLVQLLGGRGYDEANLATQIYRDARVYRIFEGATEALLDYLGSHALAQPHRMGPLLGDESVADRLNEAVEALKKASSDDDWRNALAGSALLWAIGLAAVRTRGGAGGQALALAEDGFARALDQARAGGGARVLALATGTELSAAVTALTERIGDVEQTLPGARGGVDPLLRKAFPLPGR